MAKKLKKTNVMRVLDRYHIPYTQYEYDDSNNMIDGITVAKMIGQHPNTVYKTLVTIGKGKTNFVFVLPVDQELDLKKAAKAVGEKKIEMIPVKEIEATTGYIKGGCSPIGMKKQYQTVFDASALTHAKIIFNAGKVGLQVETDPQQLASILPCQFHDICCE